MTRRRYVVATGDAFDGIALFGPFDDTDTANDYADREGLTPWHTVTLHAPDASTLRNMDIDPPAETDPRKLGTMLAALRYWQSHGAPDATCKYGSIPLLDVATNDGEHDALSAAEIDALCEELNTGAAAVPALAECAPAMTLATMRAPAMTLATMRATIAELTAERDALRAALQYCITVPGAAAYTRTREWGARRLDSITATARDALAGQS